MAVSLAAQRQSLPNVNQMIVRMTPDNSYPTGGEEVLSLLQAVSFDGVKPINSVIDIKAGLALSGTLGAVWVWDGATKMLCFCLVTGAQAANALDVSTAVVDLLVTYI